MQSDIQKTPSTIKGPLIWAAFNLLFIIVLLLGFYPMLVASSEARGPGDGQVAVHILGPILIVLGIGHLASLALAIRHSFRKQFKPAIYLAAATGVWLVVFLALEWIRTHHQIVP